MTEKFHDRFNIPVNADEAKERFVNRVKNLIFRDFWVSIPDYERQNKASMVLTILGIRESHNPFSPTWEKISDEFWQNVRATEALYKVLPRHREQISDLIETIMDLSEVDLGIRWYNEQFLPSGSKILDDKLVNDVLNCLKPEKYRGVRKPFQKGLEDFLHSIKTPARLQDVVTDLYEALEALAKIVTGRGDKDLSANMEPFIKAVQGSEAYKPILKEYIAYGNKIRHAGRDGQPKPDLTRKEVESFVYMTGVFIRLAVLNERQV